MHTSIRARAGALAALMAALAVVATAVPMTAADPADGPAAVGLLGRTQEHLPGLQQHPRVVVAARALDQ